MRQLIYTEFHKLDFWGSVANSVFEVFPHLFQLLEPA
jgi:hypothetical protein